jgi:acetyl esterase/lipase
MKRFFSGLWLLMFMPYLTAQTGDRITSLYPGAPPGSAHWDWQEQELKLGANTLVYNVSTPTLTAFEAEPSIANGTAVIVCPGGGFHMLSMDSEGYDVAKWLNGKGITAFVLKYRLVHCLTSNPMQEFMSKQPNTPKFNKDIEPVVAMGIADGKAAIAYVRTHAAEFGIDPRKIGIIGFSAGGTVAAGVAFTYDAQSRPDFVAPIYPYVGSFGDPAVPADAPPMFIAAATDDVFGFQKHCTALYDKWVDARKPAELHIYAKGNHGFGMRKQNLPTDGWIDRFYEWVKVLGF